MKLSEITPETAAAYMRLEPGEYDEALLAVVMHAARAYIAGYTGASAEELDGCEDVSDGVSRAVSGSVRQPHDVSGYPLCRENANRVVSSILDMPREEPAMNINPGELKHRIQIILAQPYRRRGRLRHRDGNRGAYLLG